MKFHLSFLVLAVAFVVLVNANGSGHENIQGGELGHVLGLHKGHRGNGAGCNGFGNNGQGQLSTSAPSTTTVASG